MHKARTPLLVNSTLVAVLLLGLYPLSYAPVVRLCGGVTFAETDYCTFIPLIESYGDGTAYPVYMPIDWLIDHTPIRHPLFAWAKLLGVEGDFEIAHRHRALVSTDLP